MRSCSVGGPAGCARVLGLPWQTLTRPRDDGRARWGRRCCRRCCRLLCCCVLVAVAAVRLRRGRRAAAAGAPAPRTTPRVAAGAPCCCAAAHLATTGTAAAAAAALACPAAPAAAGRAAPAALAARGRPGGCWWLGGCRERGVHQGRWVGQDEREDLNSLAQACACGGVERRMCQRCVDDVSTMCQRCVNDVSTMCQRCAISLLACNPVNMRLPPRKPFQTTHPSPRLWPCWLPAAAVNHCHAQQQGQHSIVA
jgi:hypothetical protein